MRFDNKVFGEYPKLREMIGNYGDELRTIRPIKRVFEKWLNADADDLPTKWWLVFDHDGWKRDLIALEAISNTRGVLGECRRIEFQSVRVEGLRGNLIGLVGYAPILGFIVKVIDGQPHEIDERYETIVPTYTLSYVGEDEPYIPNVDFE
jgi:hypothetical protein